MNIKIALSRYVPLMLLRGSTIVIKFGLSFYIARFIGLGELGIYGLIVGASLVLPNFFRAGLTSTIIRRAVDTEPVQMTHDIRHYLIWIFACYSLFILSLPFFKNLGLFQELDINIYIVWLIILVEHLAADMILLLNNIYKSRAANVFGLLQTAIWALPFVGLSLLFNKLQTIDALLAFWAVGTLFSILGFSVIFMKWPWNNSKPITCQWYSVNIRASGYLFFADLTGSLGQFVDRYIIALMIDIQHAGVYTLFFQLANAIYTLVASGILNVHRPKVISEFQKGNILLATKQLQLLKKESLGSMVILSIISGIAFQYIAPLLNRPLISNFYPLMWLIFVATIFKAWSLTSFMELYARHFDRELLWFNVFILALISVGCVAAIPFLGIYGIPLAMGLTYIFILYLTKKTVSKKNKANFYER